MIIRQKSVVLVSPLACTSSACARACRLMGARRSVAYLTCRTLPRKVSTCRVRGRLSAYLTPIPRLHLTVLAVSSIEVPDPEEYTSRN